MAKAATTVRVGKRKIELSNLEKDLFPADHIIKAELIEYYLKAAPTILQHVKGRPLSFLRFPDGIAGQPFYQKNKPEWAPEWIEHIELGDEGKVDYVLLTEEATLVWLANLACVELHQMHSRRPHFDRPDYIVFDLDPPEKYPFEQVVEIAVELRDHIEAYGYHAFVKTSGAKGVHIFAPIEPRWGFDRIFAAASEMAREFVQKHGQSTTLHIKKEARKQRLLIDIYRNRPSQTIVSPYSARGGAGAPVSMPLEWEQLLELRDPGVFNIRSAVDHLVREGDPWESMAAYATPLHTERKRPARSRTPAKKRAANRSLPESLETYAGKRSFEKTPEPPPRPVEGEGNSFVIHRHHASRLHYDLRLERDGALQSWAVPKGIPPRPGIKRLAVAVEDHPLEYARFEGTIPKGQYGGGSVWVFARGRYEFTKQKKEGFYVRLQSRELNTECRMINTRGKEWLLERLDTPQVDWLRDPIEPMLAQRHEVPPESGDYLYEVKWDGIRAMISLDEGQIVIRSRNQRDITEQFPELLIPSQAFRATCGLFDGEIVCLDGEGKPVFGDAVRRLQRKGDSAIKRASARHPAVCYLFDCLYLDGRPIINEPLTRRREWLQDAVRPNTTYRVSEAITDGVHLYDAAREMGLEGIMAKEPESPYRPGKRSPSWLKIKTHETAECVILGYTAGEGDRRPFFGALHLGEYEEGRISYVGKVGTGFDTKQLKSVYAELRQIAVTRRPITQRPADDARTVWLEPKLYCEVRFASRTKEGTYREPVFVRLRPDLAP